MVPAERSYEARDPDASLWGRILREHLLTFLEGAQDPDDPGAGVPPFVERELRAAATCGSFALGFLRVFCPDCKLQTRVAYSCQGRAACPSCGARRMVQTAANLVDHVLPDVQMRQWVVTPAWELCGLLLSDGEILSAFQRIAVAAIFRWVARKLRAAGVEGAKSGAVTFIQRWTSTLGVFPHLHILVLDGGYRADSGEGGEGAVSFHGVPPPTERDEVEVSARICAQVAGMLCRRGLVEPEAAAVRAPTLLERWYARALEERARLGSVDEDGEVSVGRGPRGRRESTGEAAGFSVHARVFVRRRDKEGRERLVRYCARPPMAEAQLSETKDGRVALELSRPRPGGQTHAVFEPVRLIRRLAWMVPPPRQHQVRFAGVLAAAAKLRPLVVPPRPVVLPNPALRSAMPEPSSARCRRIDWARLLARVGIDALECPECGGRMRVLAAITDASVLHRILSHLGLPTEAPRLAMARAPP